MYNHVIVYIRSLFPGILEIPLHEPLFNGNEKKYVLDAIDSRFVSSIGDYVVRFEDMMSQITGSRFAVATVNGTAALHTALLIAGVKTGDEVITQPLSFVATANAISYCGALPIFLDIDQSTLGLSLESLQNFLKENTIIKDKSCVNRMTGKRIAACIPVHTLGHPCQIDCIAEACKEYNIPLIEDAAESIGSYYKNQHTGTFGQCGIFSFNGNKTVTCGGGGCILTDDENLAKEAKHLTTTAKISHPYEYIHDRVGYNYRLPNLNAAMACAQLEQLEKFIEKKRELAKLYNIFFESIGIHHVNEPVNARSNYWLNTIILPDQNTRDQFLEETNNAKIMTRPTWRLLNKLGFYQGCQSDSLKTALWAEERAVNIPSSVRLEKGINRIIDA